MKAYGSLEDALQSTLLDIKEKGLVTNPRGRVSKELIGHGYVLTNPRERIIGFKARELNPFYLIGNLLWVLKQSNKLDFIKYYNPKGDMFSEDGEILPAAYGKRIFDTDGVNQWENVIKELKLDHESRRALINIHMAQYDWRGYLDTSCTSDFQFFIRDNKLHLVNHMRSQSAAFVQPYDVFLMTMLQELMANILKVDLGIYKHICNSYHYFANEEGMVDKIIASDDYIEAMPKMVGGMAEIKKLLYFEQIARIDAIQNAGRGLAADKNYLLTSLLDLGLPTFWHHFGEVLIAKAIHFTSGVSPIYTIFVKGLKNNPFQKLLLQVK